jgi:glutamate/tyrosine decarboxylase-like PLP-dependent enzyme
MHELDERGLALLEQALQIVRERLTEVDVPLDYTATVAALNSAAPSLINREGTPFEEVLEQFSNVLAPAVLSSDSTRFLSFIPSAPTKAATIFDMIVAASALNGSSWLEAAGAVHAENQALRAIADAAGLPDGAGGCFVSGGSAGNLSALAVARDTARRRLGRKAPMRVVASDQAHSSISNTANLLDCEVVPVPTVDGKMSGAAVREVLASDLDPESLCAIVATAGTTNAGRIDDLAGIAELAREYGLWFHIDAAYGGAGLFAPSVRARYNGVEQADSIVVDPHKWLFSPLDCAALLYREPGLARLVHTQHAAYLDSIRHEPQEWNPTDYAYHLSRRPRGLPTWFSMAVYGLDAYAEAVETTLRAARYAASRIREAEHLELVAEPELSIVMFRRLGWNATDYDRWADRMLVEQIAFVLPSRWEDEPILRFAIVNPDTDEAVIDDILDRTSEAP